MMAAAVLLPAVAFGAEKQKLEIVSDNLKLTLMVGEDGRLYQLGFGDASADIAIPDKELPREMEFVPAYGNGVITEPAIQATHTDGNTSTDLRYVGYRTDTVAPGITHTVISLKDPAYRFFVDVNVKCYENSGMMEMWNDIRHDERGGSSAICERAIEVSPTQLTICAHALFKSSVQSLTAISALLAGSMETSSLICAIMDS